MPSNPTQALLVIDVQESFRHMPYFRAEPVAAWLATQNQLIQRALDAQIPLVRILHVEPEGPFALASGHVRPWEGLLPFEATLTVHKHRHSAFAGTPLADTLVERGIRELWISGIRTEQCCETTTRDGSDRGFRMHYVSAATLTFPMTHRSGRIYSPDQILERTELVLDGRFARIAQVEDLGTPDPSN